MMFAEQWECLKCNWMNGFVRCRCRNCGEGRYHPDRDTNREIAADIRVAQAWDAKHGIAPETRTDTL
jgi:hypothetical protein